MSTAAAASPATRIDLSRATHRSTLEPAVITGLKRHYVRMRICDAIPEACQFRIFSEKDLGRGSPLGITSARTACWTYIPNPAQDGPHHLILLGDQFTECLKPELVGDASATIRLGENFLEHEAGHLRFTARDIKPIAEACKTLHLTFEAVNVGEDVRIEALVAAARHRPFNWGSLVAPTPAHLVTNPCDAMLAAKWLAGDAHQVEDLLTRGGVQAAQIACVLAYYRELIGAKDTYAVPGIMRRFCDEFRGAASDSSPQPSSSSSSGSAPNEGEASGQPSSGSADGSGGGAAGSNGSDGTGESKAPTNPGTDDGHQNTDGDTSKSPGSPSAASPASTPGRGEADPVPQDSADAGDAGKSGAGRTSGSTAPDQAPTEVSSRPDGEHPHGLAKPDPEGVLSPQRPSDLETSSSLEQQAALVDHLLRHAIDVSAPEGRRASPVQVTADPTLHTERDYSTASEVLAPRRVGMIDQRRVDRCVATLLQALRGRDDIISTDRPTRRLNERRSTLGSDRPYDLRIDQSGGRGPLQVVFLVDCSSSMNGSTPAGPSAISEGRHFVAVLNELAKRRRIEGFLGLSRTQYHIPQLQTIRFPLPDADIQRIEADGDGEGLALALDRMSPLIRKSDLTALYTDGQITDRPIDKDATHRLGVRLHGLYVGSMECLGKLTTHTDVPICAPTLEQLVARYARSLLSHRALRDKGR